MAYTPPDYGGYERQKGAVDYKYSTDSITNAYGRFISQQRGERGLSDMGDNFRRQQPTFKSGLAQRGIAGPGVRSGVAQQAMSRYLGDYARDFGRAQQDLTSTLQGFDLNQNNLDAWRQQEMADIEAEKARAVADDAAQLEWLRSIVGGI